MEETEMTIDTPRGTDAPGSQPAFQPEPKLDEATVRAAVMAAEARGADPVNLKIGDLPQGAPVAAEAKPPLAVPEKFQKPTGEVDVEKLKASTRQLDEAIAQKEVGIQKSVDDYIREYQEKEKRFRTLPNPERMPATLSQAPVMQQSPQALSDDQLEALINRDIQANPGRTIVQLLQLGIKQAIEPLEQDKKMNTVREQIGELAKRDPRVLNPQVFAAINQKLEADPDLWKLRNPHKAAWLEVKEDLRLGEPVSNGQIPAQPSRSASPILGGGTPPPAPSSSSANVPTFQSLSEAIAAVQKDASLRKDPKVTERLDQAAKQYFDRQFR